MYRAYLVPDATIFNNRNAMYQSKRLLWDPYSESDVYAVIGPKTKGELNKADSFEFTILPANVCYDLIKKKVSVVIIYDDDDWIFEGVVSDCPKDFYKQMKVTCAGPLSYLCDSVQAPDEKNQVVIPAPPRVRYSRVPTEWYNDTNPNEQGWFERSRETDEDGNEHYVYNVTNDTRAQVNKKYYYISSGDSDNQSGVTITKLAAKKETIHDHIDRFLAVHNSQVDAFKQIYLGTCSEDDTSEHEFKSSNYRETWTAIKSDILDQYGHYFRIWLDVDYKLRLDYASLTDLDSSLQPETSIVFTENMLDMSEADDSDDGIFTVLIPTGKNGLTFKSSYTDHDNPAHNDQRMVNPYIKAMGGNKRFIVVSQAAVNKYGVIVKPQTFSDASSQDKLWSAAVKYIKNNFDTHSEYEVKGIDAHALNPRESRIVVGKKCRIRSDWHNVDESDLYVIAAENDLANPDNDSFKIGIPTSDREAKNKTITGQTSSSSARSAGGYANNAAGINNIETWLYDYFDQVEGWLELTNKYRNEVGAITSGLLTRLEQAEDHITLLSTKLFGDSDAGGSANAGYIVIPKPPYRKTGNGIEDYYDSTDTNLYKVPVNHGWYERVVENGKTVYRKSTQDTRVTQSQVDNPNVQFYIRRLSSRDSEVTVDENGINATVNGNYDRSIANSSWIRMNEDQILALTGHLYVDEDGHVHIISGGGMVVTSETPQATTNPHYVLVPKTMYVSNPRPVDKHWYERKYNNNNEWPGATAADRETNDNYYELTTDTEINRNKAYYYKSGATETITMENGVFDQDNLTAGVLAQTINHPTYVRVTVLDIAYAVTHGKNPATSGWFEYDETTGNYGLSTDIVIIQSKTYYKRINNATTYTEIRGDHIRVGNPGESVDPAVYARAEQYIRDKNLNGTITEIASDVVIANAIIAKYLEADTIVANTKLASDHIYANTIKATDSVLASQKIGGADIWLWSPSLDGGDSPNSGNSIRKNLIKTVTISGADYDSFRVYRATNLSTKLSFNDSDSIRVCFDTMDDISRGFNLARYVTSFGTATYSGDTVSIPYTLVGDTQAEAELHVLSFNKPASLGSVTWSSGNKSLTIKTAGGTDFFVGQIGQYIPTGQEEAAAINNAVYLDTETSGYNTAYGIYYSVNGSSRKTLMFKTPKDRYEDGKTDGISLAKTKFGIISPIAATTVTTAEANSYNSAPTLSYDAGYMYYSTYDGVQWSAKQYFKTPAKPSANGVTRAVKSGTTYNDGDEITLGYSDSVKIYGRYKLSDTNSYTNCEGITVKSPADNSTNITQNDISTGSVTRYSYNDANKPSADYTFNESNPIGIAAEVSYYIYFTVTVLGVSKRYRIRVNGTN